MAIRKIDPNKTRKVGTYKLKPYQIPEGFQIIIDTREQKPYPLSKLPTVRSVLHNGDYSIVGMEDLFAIERKQMSDFYSYIGSERVKKTQNKINRFCEMQRRGGFVGLIIEVDEKDLFAPSDTRHSNVSPEVARQFLVSWQVRYGLHVYLSKDRKMCERWMVDRMIKFWKVKNGE